jgi:hypothetical protein
MRTRVSDFVKVLSRASTNQQPKPKRITTAAGKTLIK